MNGGNTFPVQGKVKEFVIRKPHFKKKMARRNSPNRK